jgi:hypothetical protein
MRIYKKSNQNCVFLESAKRGSGFAAIQGIPKCEDLKEEKKEE